MGDTDIGMRLVVDMVCPDLLGGSPGVRGKKEARRDGYLRRDVSKWVFGKI